MTTVEQLATRYERLPEQLRSIAEQYPGATVVRNQVGNLSILTADGTYIAWVDVLTGEVEPV